MGAEGFDAWSKAYVASIVPESFRDVTWAFRTHCANDASQSRRLAVSRPHSSSRTGRRRDERIAALEARAAGEPLRRVARRGAAEDVDHVELLVFRRE